MKIPIHVWKAFIEKKPLDVDDQSLAIMRRLIKMKEQGKLSEITFIINRHNVFVNLKRDTNSIG